MKFRLLLVAMILPTLAACKEDHQARFKQSCEETNGTEYSEFCDCFFENLSKEISEDDMEIYLTLGEIGTQGTLEKFSLARIQGVNDRVDQATTTGSVKQCYPE